MLAFTRNKVLEILAHINKRVKPQPSILLPVKDLLDQYLDPEVPAIVKNFSIIYLEMGFYRLPLEVLYSTTTVIRNSR